MMGKWVFPWVLGISILLVVLAVFLPGGQPREETINLPWQVEQVAGGYTKVFGLTLGKSTLQDTEQMLQENAIVSMFATDAGQRTVEGFFKKVNVSGIRAKMIVALDFSDEALQKIYDRGARIATLGQGNRKVTLSTEDVALAMETPIATITYLPRVNLDSVLVEKRFGIPARKVKEQNSDIEHWLYPEIGLDIALSDEGKDVLQYTLPGKFDQLVAPLGQ